MSGHDINAFGATLDFQRMTAVYRASLQVGLGSSCPRRWSGGHAANSWPAGSSKLPPLLSGRRRRQQRSVRTRLANGESTRDIAKDFAVHLATIARLRLGRPTISLAASRPRARAEACRLLLVVVDNLDGDQRLMVMSGDAEGSRLVLVQIGGALCARKHPVHCSRPDLGPASRCGVRP